MQKSKRRQSGAGQWRSLVPLAAISSGILLVVASIIGLIGYEAPYITRGLLQLHVGDVVRLGSEAEGTPFPTMDVRAVVVSAPGLAPGSICSLGMGGAAGGGGTLRDPALRAGPILHRIMGRDWPQHSRRAGLRA